MGVVILPLLIFIIVVVFFVSRITLVSIEELGDSSALETIIPVIMGNSTFIFVIAAAAGLMLALGLSYAINRPLQP